LTENVIPDYGGYLITWDFTADVRRNMLHFEGNKAIVDGKEATLGEKKTIVTFQLKLRGLSAKGKFEKVNYKNDILQGYVDITFSSFDKWLDKN